MLIVYLPCSCTEASLFSVTRVPVSFLHLLHALSNRSEDLLRNSVIRSPPPLRFVSSVGYACLNCVTVLLHLLSATAIASTFKMKSAWLSDPIFFDHTYLHLAPIPYLVEHNLVLLDDHPVSDLLDATL